jgi:TonB family protein
VLVAVLGQLGSGCKSAPPPVIRPAYESDGDVRAQLVEAAERDSYRTGSGTTYSGSQPAKDNAAPQYPAGLLSSRLPPVTVMVRVIVDVEGAVADAAIAASDGVQPEFAAAVLSAVRSWRFDPLQRMTEGRVEALPFSQLYRFQFTQVNGRAVVRSADAVSH